MSPGVTVKCASRLEHAMTTHGPGLAKTKQAALADALVVHADGHVWVRRRDSDGDHYIGRLSTQDAARSSDLGTTHVYPTLDGIEGCAACRDGQCVQEIRRYPECAELVVHDWRQALN